MAEQDEVLAANAAYYRAFADCDIAAMRDIWAVDDVSCIHPGWPALIGRRPVLESYFGIMSNPHHEPIEYRNDTALISGTEARVFCVEIVGGMRLVATNWFRFIDDEWRMIHHQASPMGPIAEQPEPLAAGRRLN
jgi:ketosteroid isomerase-like protein